MVIGKVSRAFLWPVSSIRWVSRPSVGDLGVGVGGFVTAVSLARDDLSGSGAPAGGVCNRLGGGLWVLFRRPLPMCAPADVVGLNIPANIFHWLWLCRFS